MIHIDPHVKFLYYPLLIIDFGFPKNDAFVKLEVMAK